MATAKEEMEIFYKKKKKYDSKYNTAKNRILHDSELSKEEKREQLKKIKPQCLGCKRSVGTIFTPSIGRVKEAKCGDTASPCPYNIRINYGTYEYAPKLLDKINHDVDLYQFNISKIKYNLLFGLVSEEEMELSFNETKDKYKDLMSYKTMIQNFLDKFNTVEIEGSDGLEDTIIDKRIYIQTKKNELEGMISEFRTMISEYTSSTNGDEKQSFISDAIDLYLNRITPVMKIIRDTLYEITTVLKEKGQFVLIQKEHDLKSMIIEIDPMTFASGENDDDDTDENDDDNTDEDTDEEDPWMTMDE
jgi:hypothetical protein